MKHYFLNGHRLDDFRELGIGIVAYSPLGMGFLSYGPKLVDTLSDKDFRKVRFRNSFFLKVDHYHLMKVFYAISGLA